MRTLRRRDLYVRDVTQDRIDALDTMVSLLRLVYDHDPEWEKHLTAAEDFINHIAECWRSKEREYAEHSPPDSYDCLGTTKMSAHAAKKTCPTCGGRGKIVDVVREEKALKKEKETLGL